MMQPLTRPRRWAPLLALTLILAGCGASATAKTGAASPSATATSTPAPTATPPWTTLPNCGIANVFTQAQRLGDTDFVISGLQLSNVAYPGQQIQDGTALKPLQVDSHTWQLPYSSLPTNPSMQSGGGFNLSLCNGSPSQAHTVTSVSVRVESFTPYTGQLNELPACKGPYSRGGQIGGGCGGGNENDEFLQATFTGEVGAGTTAEATQLSTGPFNMLYQGQPPYGPIPVTLQHGKAMTVNVAIALPNPSGTYTFSVGIALDGHPPVFSAPTDAILLAPVAHVWSGQACEVPAMQSQIPPATTPPTYYICPAS